MTEFSTHLQGVKLSNLVGFGHSACRYFAGLTLVMKRLIVERKGTALPGYGTTEKC